MRAMIERLDSEGIENCKQDYPDFVFQWLKDEGFDAGGSGDKEKFLTWLDGFIERNGDLEVSKILCTRWQYEIKTRDSGRMATPEAIPPLYVEYNKFVNNFRKKKFGAKEIDDVFATLRHTEVSAGTLNELDKALDNLQATLEGLKEGASQQDVDSLNALGDVFSGLNAGHHRREELARLALHAIENQGLVAAREVLLDSLAEHRCYMILDEDVGAQRAKASVHLDNLISAFGLEAVEEQFRLRYRNMVSSDDLQSQSSNNFNCSDELENAIKQLYGWDELMTKFGGKIKTTDD